MRINIHAQGLTLGESMRRFASDRIGMALSRISRNIKLVQLHFVDVNGPKRNGPDKYCRVIVQINGQKTIVLQDQDSSIGMVIDRIADRLDEAVSRRVDRHRIRRQSTGRLSSLFEA